MGKILMKGSEDFRSRYEAGVCLRHGVFLPCAGSLYAGFLFQRLTVLEKCAKKAACLQWHNPTGERGPNAFSEGYRQALLVTTLGKKFREGSWRIPPFRFMRFELSSQVFRFGYVKSHDSVSANSNAKASHLRRFSQLLTYFKICQPRQKYICHIVNFKQPHTLPCVFRHRPSAR